MSEQSLTHWKKTVNPDYLGSYALQPGEDMVVTIKEARTEMVVGNAGKREEKLVIHFKEQGVKPMICNRTNAKVITKLHKTPYLEQWQGKQIQLYATRVNAFGEDVEALRIREYLPKAVEIDPTAAIEAINECQTLGELKGVYAALSKAEQAHPQVVKAKDARKEVLK